jgi:hypothetical protein
MCHGEETPMRTLIALAFVLLPSPALAQGYDLYQEHPAGGSGNGASRLNDRVDTSIVAKAKPVQSPMTQPANSNIHVYQPRPLNDLAKDWAKAHPDELPNRRKPDPR